jgi:hypothetical protein
MQDAFQFVLVDVSIVVLIEKGEQFLEVVTFVVFLEVAQCVYEFVQVDCLAVVEV